MEHATIAAIATPAGRGGIGIVKISGPAAIEIAAALFSPSGLEADNCTVNSICNAPKKDFTASAHSLFYGHIFDPKTRCVVDEVLLGVMKAPHSYTREDVVEINAHGGGVVLKAILNLVLQKGARLAQPGEFTKRAYLNGRIDLTQAEAVVDLINARTEKELQIVTRHLDGHMGRAVERLRQRLRDVLVKIEAAIDFPQAIEEGLDFEKESEILQENVITELRGLIDQYQRAHVYREGMNVVITGKPNVGKSSLMNRLLHKDRVIVTPLPGTTRDSIEETINLNGVPVVLTDTAGLHEPKDPIEKLGIKKVHEYIEQADLLLFVVDLSEAITKQDHDVYRKVRHKEMILVQNKSDLVSSDFVMAIPTSWQCDHMVRTSALHKRGLNELRNVISKKALGEEPLDTADKIVPSLRHRQALEKSLGSAIAAQTGMHDKISPELTAIEIKDSLDSLGEISGKTATNEILDQIFARFCIGK